MVPAGLVDSLRERQIKQVRVLLSGEIRRLETALPPKLSFSEASALMAHEVADQSGADGMNLVCAGGSGSLVGVVEPCMLSGAFERQHVAGLHQQLTQAGFQFGGVGSLELACAAYWNATHDRDRESLILFGRDHGFVLPARMLPDQPGPIGLSGGLRQVGRDPEAWQTRFFRGNRYLMKAGSLSVFALGGDLGEASPLLESIEGFPQPSYPDPETLLEGAARQAVQGQANQFSAPVPIRNPHVLRKRFSHAFIVAPCVLILLLPLAFAGLLKGLYNLELTGYEEIAERYAPLESRIKNAERKKEQAQTRYDNSVALQLNLADRRKPLFAFIHLAYFFSKYAGDTVRLDSIIDKGGTIDVKGIYTDPEDGLSLKAELNTFAADKNLRIVHNRVAEQQTADGRIVLGLELSVDYTGLSK